LDTKLNDKRFWTEKMQTSPEFSLILTDSRKWDRQAVQKKSLNKYQPIPRNKPDEPTYHPHSSGSLQNSNFKSLKFLEITEI